MDKHVLIICYNFWPEQTPRSFRAYELAKEFFARNYHVTVITKKIGINRDVPEVEKLFEFPVRINDSNLYVPSRMSFSILNPNQFQKKPQMTLPKFKYKLPSTLHFWKLLIWPSLWSWEFAHKGEIYLKNKRLSTFDLTISVDSGLPSHLLTYKLWKKGLTLGTIVGDCGDPFTFNPNRNFSIYNYFREKHLLSCFNYLTVPTPKAIKAFTKLGISKKKIKVIPQGFSFDLPQHTVSLSKFKFSKKLIYGGKFNKKIRNPENFFKALVLLKNMKQNISCFIFTDLKDRYVAYLQSRYQEALEDMLFFFDIIPRNDFLSLIQDQTVFCLNFLNKSKYQVPSKLIDYATAKANVYDIHMDMTPENIVKKILDEDHYKPELNQEFNIKNVVDKFVALIS